MSDVQLGTGLLPENRTGLPAIPRWAPTVKAERHDLVSLVRRVRRQPGSSCVGNAFAAAIELRSDALGIGIDDVSALAIYTMAREAWGTTIADVGCRARDAADALEQRGIVSEERWPTGDAHLNELLPWDVFQAGLGARVEGLVRVDGWDAIQDAVAHAEPVAFGMMVDEAYQAFRGGAYAPGGRSVGGHMQVVVATAETPAGARRCLVLNSWGDDWGDSGFVWLDAAMVLGGFDHYALRVVPEEVS